MNPLQFLLILRAHYKVVLYTLVGAVLVGGAVCLLQAKQYTTATILVFDVRADPVAGMLLPATPGYMATQVEIINSDRVALKVVKLLKLDESPAVKQQWVKATEGKGDIAMWVGELLRRSLIVAPSRDSNTMTVTYSASVPGFAAVVANSFAQAYIDTNIELKVAPARQYSHWFGDQGMVLRASLEKAQARVSEFQQAHGIVSKDEQQDAELAKLNALSAQLTVVQGQTADAQSKERSGAATLPEVMQNSLIQSLTADIAHQEVKLKEAAGNLGTNHPQYQRMESEMVALKKQLEVRKLDVTSSFSTLKTVGQDIESKLKAAIADQKKKLLEFRNERDQLAVLQRDVDAAQIAYNGVTARYNQTSLESQVTQANVTVLSPAVEPLYPTSPNRKKIMLVSVVLGALFSAGIVVILELLDRRIRSVDDLAEMLQVPVLATIERPRKQNRLLDFTRRKTMLALR